MILKITQQELIGKFLLILARAEEENSCHPVALHFSLIIWMPLSHSSAIKQFSTQNIWMGRERRGGERGSDGEIEKIENSTLMAYHRWWMAVDRPWWWRRRSRRKTFPHPFDIKMTLWELWLFVRNLSTRRHHLRRAYCDDSKDNGKSFPCEHRSSSENENFSLPADKKGKVYCFGEAQKAQSVGGKTKKNEKSCHKLRTRWIILFATFNCFIFRRLCV